MIRFVAALIAAAPLAVLAQETPSAPAPAAPDATAPAPAAAQPAQYPQQPGQYPAQPPPPAYQPPPTPWQRPPQTRDSWYIGFGIGSGDGTVSGQGESFGFKEFAVTSPTNVSFEFKLGATLSPQLLVGGEINDIVSVASSNGVDTSLGIVNYLGVATFFPMEKGLFVRGGLGLSKLNYEIKDSMGTDTFSASGFGTLIGAGYAFWLGRSFNLTLNLDFSKQWYGSSNDKPESSQYWTGYVGFDWY